MARPTRTTQLPITDRRAVLDPVYGWKRKMGTLVPKAECCGHYCRISPTEMIEVPGPTAFARWMADVMDSDDEAEDVTS